MHSLGEAATAVKVAVWPARPVPVALAAVRAVALQDLDDVAVPAHNRERQGSPRGRRLSRWARAQAEQHLHLTVVAQGGGVRGATGE